MLYVKCIMLYVKCIMLYTLEDYMILLNNPLGHCVII